MREISRQGGGSSGEENLASKNAEYIKKLLSNYNQTYETGVSKNVNQNLAVVKDFNETVRNLALVSLKLARLIDGDAQIMDDIDSKEREDLLVLKKDVATFIFHRSKSERDFLMAVLFKNDDVLIELNGNYYLGNNPETEESRATGYDLTTIWTKQYNIVEFCNKFFHEQNLEEVREHTPHFYERTPQNDDSAVSPQTSGATSIREEMEGFGMRAVSVLSPIALSALSPVIPTPPSPDSSAQSMVSIGGTAATLSAGSSLSSVESDVTAGPDSPLPPHAIEANEHRERVVRETSAFFREVMADHEKSFKESNEELKTEVAETLARAAKKIASNFAEDLQLRKIDYVENGIKYSLKNEDEEAKFEVNVFFLNNDSQPNQNIVIQIGSGYFNDSKPQEIIFSFDDFARKYFEERINLEEYEKVKSAISARSANLEGEESGSGWRDSPFSSEEGPFGLGSSDFTKIFEDLEPRAPKGRPNTSFRVGRYQAPPKEVEEGRGGGR